jgi:hypothetical protein
LPSNFYFSLPGFSAKRITLKKRGVEFYTLAPLTLKKALHDAPPKSFDNLSGLKCPKVATLYFLTLCRSRVARCTPMSKPDRSKKTGQVAPPKKGLFFDVSHWSPL